MNESATGILLVFDLETTGLPPKKKPTGEPADLSDWPSITQMSAILYDSTRGIILSHMNHYISLDENVVVPPEVAVLTGITTELCQSRGIPLTSAICSFYELYCRADYVVAHNLAFDRSIIRVEIQRKEGELPPFCRSMFSEGPGHHPAPLCTMLKYKHFCGIQAVSAKGWNYTKNPRLSEVYDRLFHGEDNSSSAFRLHNSIVDTLLCLRCLVFLECGQRIPDATFHSLIETLSEPMDQPLYSMAYRTRKHTAQHRPVLCL